MCKMTYSHTKSGFNGAAKKIIYYDDIVGWAGNSFFPEVAPLSESITGTQIQHKTAAITAALLGWISCLTAWRKKYRSATFTESYSSSEMVVAWLLKLKCGEECTLVSVNYRPKRLQHICIYKKQVHTHKHTHSDTEIYLDRSNRLRCLYQGCVPRYKHFSK